MSPRQKGRGSSIAPRCRVEQLVPHAEALDRLWAGLGQGLAPAPWCLRARKDFFGDGAGQWVAFGSGGEGRTDDADAIRWLDARWELVKRLFYAHEAVVPFIRGLSDPSPRPAEGWQWSCIGIPRLFEAWTAPRGIVRADLRPALLSLESGEGFEQEELREYEVSYPVDRLVAFGVEVRRDLAAGEPRDFWRGTLRLCALCHGGLPDASAERLLEDLSAAGVARRSGRWVQVGVGRGETRRVRTTSFRRAAEEILAQI